jgi:hypothetical protein
MQTALSLTCSHQISDHEHSCLAIRTWRQLLTCLT